jgi:uncharacterized protein
VRRLFGFEQVFEAYVPPLRRRFGYFTMPVLAGDRLMARVDVRADRSAGSLRAVAAHFEPGHDDGSVREAVRTAVARHASALGLAVTPAL